MTELSARSSPGDNPVDEIIADFLEATERGESPNPQAYLDRHPQFAKELSEFFAGYSQLKRIIPPDTAEDAAFGSSSAGDPSDPNTPTLNYSEGAEDEVANQDVARYMVRYMGDYELLDEIARGGMGVVFKARQTSLNRVVALKMILAGVFASEEDVKRFHLEAEAAAQLDHPGIVPIYEVGQHEGHHYFSMGFVDGSSLSRQLVDGPLPPRIAAEIVRQVAEAVQYAHSKGVIHRDLKPGNILIDPQGHPRVTDFGLAKRLESGSDLTGTGQILGTPSYMPPEQAAGHMSAVGPLSDVYSLGAILFCTLTGRPPFQAANPLDTLLQVQRQEPVSLRSLNENIPADLETIALKCLDKSPARRYASAQDLADELQRYLEGRPIQARPVSRLERGWRWCRRNPTVAGLCATVAATLMVATIVSSGYARSEHARALSEANAKAEVIRQSKKIQDDANTIQEQSENVQREHEVGQQQLAKAQLAEARALRMSGRPGQRFGALRAIRDSMKITGPTRALADAAAAALCLPDWEVDFEWEGFPPDTKCLAVSPTFDRYVRVNDKGIVSLRSLPDDHEITTFQATGTHDYYGGLRFSRDGRFVFERYSGSPYRARAWLMTNDQPRLVTEQNCHWAESLDGRHVIMAKGSQLMIVDAEGVEPERFIPMGEDASGALFGGHPGDSTVALNLGEFWRTVDIQTGQLGEKHALRDGISNWPAVFPGGHEVVWTTNVNARGMMQDLTTGRVLTPPFTGHQSKGLVPFVSRCGSVVFTNDWSYVLRMWDPRTGRSLLNRPSAGSLNWLTVSLDGQRIGPEITGSKVRWLRFATGREYCLIAASPAADKPVLYGEASATSFDGKLLALGTSNGVVLFDSPSGLPLAAVNKHMGTGDHIVGFFNNATLMTVEGRRLVTRTIIRADDGSLSVGCPTVFDANVMAPGGVHVRSSCSADGRVFGLPLGYQGALLIQHEKRDGTLSARTQLLETGIDIRIVAVSPDGRWLATGRFGAKPEDLSHNAQVWEVSTGRLVKEFEIRSYCWVRFSASGRYLTAYSNESTECRVIDTETWELIGKFISKGAGIFSPDDTLFAIESGPGEISLRYGRGLREFAKLSSPEEQTFRLMFFLPDNSRFDGPVLATHVRLKHHTRQRPR